MHLVLVNGLESLLRNSAVRLTDPLDMTIVVDWDIKPQINPTNSLHYTVFVLLRKSCALLSVRLILC